MHDEHSPRTVAAGTSVPIRHRRELPRTIGAEAPPTKIGASAALRSLRDLQSLAYLAAVPAVMAWQWLHGFSWLLYPLLKFLMVGIGVIHHNHAHLPIWRSRMLNRATDLLITLLQGHPTFVFLPAHVGNHHRHRHDEHDIARTYRFGGDSNSLRGWLLHPLQAIGVIYPLLFGWLTRLRTRSPGAFRWCITQYALWLSSWCVLLAIDPVKAIIFVIGPQLFGLHWLLAANYLQHAHADGNSHINYARNFEGLLNPLLFNIGLHTAHHEHPRAHWSELPAHHREWREVVDARLNERSFVRYVLRVFVAGAFSSRWRSQSLMSPFAAPTCADAKIRIAHADPL